MACLDLLWLHARLRLVITAMPGVLIPWLAGGVSQLCSVMELFAGALHSTVLVMFPRLNKMLLEGRTRKMVGQMLTELQLMGRQGFTAC